MPTLWTKITPPALALALGLAAGCAPGLPAGWTEAQFCAHRLAVESLIWGPCTIDDKGTPIGCAAGSMCVVSSDAGGHVCAPVDNCEGDPLELPGAPDGYDPSVHELGLGGACQMRCEFDVDCAPGLLCFPGSDLLNFCAWAFYPECTAGLAALEVVVQ